MSSTMTESERFETEVYPVVLRYARMRFRGDDELVSLALILAWWVWSTRRADFPPSAYAQIGVRQAYAGRDLPGFGIRSRDAFKRAQQGGGMEGLTDRYPGPEKLAEQAELSRLLLATFSERERLLAELLVSGMKAKDVATELGVSPPRVTQIRQKLMERLADME